MGTGRCGTLVLDPHKHQDLTDNVKNMSINGIYN